MGRFLIFNDLSDRILTEEGFAQHMVILWIGQDSGLVPDILCSCHTRI